MNSFFSPLPFVSKQHQGVAAYCDIESVIILLKRFPKEKKDVVDFLGFGSLLKYNIMTLRSNMCLWMLNNFDPESKTFNIHGKIINFKPIHVQNILGFKAEGSTVVEKEDKSKQTKYSLDFANIDVKNLCAILVKLDASVDNFKRALVLLLITALFAPTYSNKPKESWLHLLEYVEIIPSLNWGQFIYDNIIVASKVYKEKKDKKNCSWWMHSIIHGKLIFLIIK